MSDPNKVGWDIDPDPFVVASLSMTAAALVLQLVQTWKAFRPTAAPSLPPSASTVSNINYLEEAVSKLQSDLRQIHRLIDRGSPSSESEFYEAPYRIAETSLNLDRPVHIQLQQQLGMGFADLGNVSQWVNHIIREDPAAAARIGGRMAAPMEETAVLLNRVMRDGGPNRLIVQEAKHALEQLAGAIEQELHSGSN